MSKRLTEDGESRTIRPKPYNKHCKEHFEVTALRIDADTPFVRLTLFDRFAETPQQITVELADADADELIRQLKAALAILPTSK